MVILRPSSIYAPKNFLINYLAKIKVSLIIPKLKLMCVLLYTDKSSLDLKACFRHMIEKNISFVSLMLFLDPFADLVTCLDSEIPLRKKSSLE